VTLAFLQPRLGRVNLDNVGGCYCATALASLAATAIRRHVGRAERVGIPTINGYSGNFPPGWEFYDSGDVNYERNARAWAAHRGIDVGLCRFDMANGKFAGGH
jgi:hypothetical protein